MPGSTKMLSSTTVPDTSKPTCRPSTVSAGMKAFFSAWRSTTACSARPLAEAVRMKSWRSTSSIWVRIRRISPPLRPSPRMSAGTMMMLRFLVGSSSKRVYRSGGVQCHHTDGSVTTSVPSQKPGMASSADGRAARDVVHPGVLAHRRDHPDRDGDASPRSSATPCPARASPACGRQLLGDRAACCGTNAPGRRAAIVPSQSTYCSRSACRARAVRAAPPRRPPCSWRPAAATSPRRPAAAAPGRTRRCSRRSASAPAARAGARDSGSPVSSWPSSTRG